jgi:hypothetical protein
MEFHQPQFHGIQWNSMEKYNEKNPSNVYEKFHGIPWNSMDMEKSIKFHGIPWNSMEFHGKFHELTERFSPGSVSNLL